MLFQLFSFICFASVRKSCIEISTDKGFLSLVYFTSHYSNGIKLAYIFLSATSLVNYGEIKHLLKQPPRYHLRTCFLAVRCGSVSQCRLCFGEKLKGSSGGGKGVYKCYYTKNDLENVRMWCQM